MTTSCSRRSETISVPPGFTVVKRRLSLVRSSIFSPSMVTSRISLLSTFCMNSEKDSCPLRDAPEPSCSTLKSVTINRTRIAQKTRFLELPNDRSSCRRGTEGAASVIQIGSLIARGKIREPAPLVHARGIFAEITGRSGDAWNRNAIAPVLPVAGRPCGSHSILLIAGATMCIMFGVSVCGSVFSQIPSARPLDCSMRNPCGDVGEFRRVAVEKAGSRHGGGSGRIGSGKDGRDGLTHLAGGACPCRGRGPHAISFRAAEMAASMRAESADQPFTLWQGGRGNQPTAIPDQGFGVERDRAGGRTRLAADQDALTHRTREDKTAAKGHRRRRLGGAIRDAIA